MVITIDFMMNKIAIHMMHGEKTSFGWPSKWKQTVGDFPVWQFSLRSSSKSANLSSPSKI